MSSPIFPLQVCLTLSKCSSFLNSFTEHFCDLPAWPCLFRPGKHSLVPLSFLSLSCQTLLSKRTHWANGLTRSEGEPSQSHKGISRSVLLSEGKADYPPLPHSSDFRFETLLGLFSPVMLQWGISLTSSLRATPRIVSALRLCSPSHTCPIFFVVSLQTPSMFKGPPAVLHLRFLLQPALHSCLTSETLLWIIHAVHSMAGPETLSNLYGVSQLTPAFF